MTPPCQLWSVRGSSSALALRLAVGADGLIDTRAWPTRAGARRTVVEYIAWYNGTRLHSSLGYQSPADYDNNHYENVRRGA
jgi:transposase InsO family protein